jgi:hypothetical protein
VENPTTAHPPFGPWNGIDESEDIGPKRLRDGLNVIFREGQIQRRPGRRIVAVDPNGRRVVGLHEHVAAAGGRSVIAFFDPAGANPGGLATVDWNAGAPANVAMPVEVAAFPPGGSTAAIAMDGHTILAEPGGTLLDFDGEHLDVLAAHRGEDAGVQNETYLAAPPKATHLTVWRDRVVAGGAPEAPRTLGLSENKWADANIPDDAPIGGANLWPSRTNFDLSTEDGDQVQGLSVLFDRLVVPGRAGVNIVDEDALSPVARAVARQHGCVAPRSLVNIGDALIYLGEGDVLLFDGERAMAISGAMRRTLDELVDWDSAHGAVAVHLRRAQEYRIWVPVKGLPGNQLCLICEYGKRPDYRWRKASHWYLFDSAARRDLPYKFDATAARAVILESGREVLLTGDSAGRIWLEDVGEDDEGQIFPAFAALPAVSQTAKHQTFRDVHLDCLHDGSFVGVLAVMDGRSVEQEILRVLDGDLVSGAGENDIPYVANRALRDGQQTWPGAEAWPIQVQGPVMAELDFGIVQRGQKIQVVLLLPGQLGGVIDPAPGAIRRLALGARERGGLRQ